MIKNNSEIQLSEDEISFFLKKIDVAKLSDRISKHYNIISIDKFREFLEISPEVKLSEFLLIKLYKEKDIPNKILNENEKIELKRIYLKETKAKLDKKRKKENSETEQKQKFITDLIKSSEKLTNSLRNLLQITIKQKNKVLKMINDINICLEKKELILEHINILETYQRILTLIINKPSYTNLNEKNRIEK